MSIIEQVIEMYYVMFLLIKQYPLIFGTIAGAIYATYRYQTRSTK